MTILKPAMGVMHYHFGTVLCDVSQSAEGSLVVKACEEVLSLRAVGGHKVRAVLLKQNAVGQMLTWFKEYHPQKRMHSLHLQREGRKENLE